MAISGTDWLKPQRVIERTQERHGIHVGRASRRLRVDLGLATFTFTCVPLSSAENSVRRNDAAFRLAVNRALASMYRSGEVGPIFEKYFGSMTTAGATVVSMYLMNGLPE